MRIANLGKKNGMGNAVHQVRAYVAEMLHSTRLLRCALAEYARNRPGGAQMQWAVERVQRTLSSHAEEVAEHLTRLGGAALMAELPKASAGATPGIANVRELYSALIDMDERLLLLETNARALGFSSSAALMRRHREELAT